jgi:hypothetical protein
MNVKITFMDGSPDLPTTTTQTMEQITTALNTDRFVNIGTVTVMSVKVNTVEEVTTP